MKSLCTEIAVEGIESCRRCCGGHGYSKFGGLITLYNNEVGLVTAEGENWLLTQQVAKYLLVLCPIIFFEGC